LTLHWSDTDKHVWDKPDWSKYPAGLWGFAGVNPHEVASMRHLPARRSRIGRGLYKTGLARLPDGRLLASPCYSNGKGTWSIRIYRSSDEGITWTRLQTAGDRLLGKEPALVALSTGSVLLLTSHPHGFRVSASSDGGVTWRTTKLGDGFGTVRTVFENPDGTLRMLMSKGAYYNRGAPPSKAWWYVSKDGGLSWFQEEPVAWWDEPESMFDEASLVRLEDGRILAASRMSGDHPLERPPPRGLPTPSGDESGDHMILVESQDGGITWTTPRGFLGYAEVHAHLLPLMDGRILCTYASYHLPYGVFAVTSEDGGRTSGH